MQVVRAREGKESPWYRREMFLGGCFLRLRRGRGETRPIICGPPLRENSDDSLRNLSWEGLLAEGSGSFLLRRGRARICPRMIPAGLLARREF